MLITIKNKFRPCCLYVTYAWVSDIVCMSAFIYFVNVICVFWFFGYLFFFTVIYYFILLFFIMF